MNPSISTNAKATTTMHAKQNLLLLLLGMVISVWISPIAAAPSLSVGSVTAWPIAMGGRMEAVPINFVTDAPVSGLQFDIVYDPTQLDASRIFTAGPALGSHALSVAWPATNRIRVVITPPTTGNGTLAQGTLLTLPFTLKSDATPSPKILTVNSVMLGAPTAEPVTANVQNGSVSWKPNFDGDGLPDEWDEDDDNDGMPDWYESKYGLNPYYAGDANIDLDGDGLTNLQESRLGTNPKAADTDGDGLPDNADPHPMISEKVLPAIITIINSLLLD